MSTGQKYYFEYNVWYSAKNITWETLAQCEPERLGNIFHQCLCVYCPRCLTKTLGNHPCRKENICVNYVGL